MLSQDEQNAFDAAWLAAEAYGWVDGIGGAEYRRILGRWLTAGKPPFVRLFLAVESALTSDPMRGAAPPAETE